MTEKLYFEDFSVGDVLVGDTVTVDREHMLWFSREFDDQPMHNDPAAARAMGLKDIIATGAYIFSLTAKSQGGIWRRMHMLPSGLGIETSFLKPVYAGDTITAHIEVPSVRPSRKPGRGWVDTKASYLNQDQETVVEGGGAWLLLARPEK